MLVEKSLEFSDGGSVHGLVNNVGSNIRKPTVEMCEEDYRFVMQTNLDSAWHLSQLIYPVLTAIKKKGVSDVDSSVIVNISSICGHSAINTGAVYAMTKGAMNQMTRSLAWSVPTRTCSSSCVLSLDTFFGP